MRIEQFQYLAEVVRCGHNISEAAKALGTTQPAISRQLLLLEEELGVPIFIRAKRRLLGLTEPGAAIADTARHIVDQAENVRRIASEHQGGAQAGRFTVATTHTQARHALPDVMRRFIARYPKVEITLRQDSPAEIAALVAAGLADVGIASEAPERSADLLSLPAYELQRIVLVPAGHPLLRQKTRLTLEALARHPVVTYDDTFIGRSRVTSAFAARGLKPRIVLSAMDTDVIKTYVEHGLGVGIVAQMAYDPRRDRGLRAIPAGHLFAPNVISVMIRRSSYLRGYAYDFIELFASRLKRDVVAQALRERPAGRA
jgi:LysR family transcriptional regulator, cys regulon transcriptional activator